MNQRAHVACGTVGIVIGCMVAAIVHAAQDRPGPEQRVYAGKELAKAREKLKAHKFHDKELQDTFRYDNKFVEVVALEMRREGTMISEIKVFRSGKDDKGRFVLLRVLGNPSDPDFKGLVQHLAL